MFDYQIAVILFFVYMLLSIIVTILTKSAIKKHKAKKEILAELVKENKQLKDKIYRLRLNAELRGLKIDD